MTDSPLTDTQLDLDAIQAKADELRERLNRKNPWPSDNESHWMTEGWRNGTRNALDKLHVEALVAEVHRLRAERDEFCDRVDTLTAVAKGNKRHVQEMFLELQKAQAALTAIRHLHKDSPMGPCPICIDADAIAAGGDGLVPYPCPTGRLAGAQDCDPPARPAPSA